MAAIVTHALRRTFGSTIAVEALELSVEPGEIHGLVGPDGSGKTTTLRMLAGILPPTAGQVNVAACDVVRTPEAVKQKIGYMSQRFGLYPDLTVRENLSFYADIQGVPRHGRGPLFSRLLGFSQLTPFSDRRAGRLSGGMKQKLGLACALVHTPQVLLLDEPTNGVDPVSRRDFWVILRELRRDGVTILVSTSYLDEAERCDRVSLLHQGRRMAHGTPAEIKALLPGRLLEVRTDAPRRLAGRLREQWPKSSVGLFGERVHITGGPDDAETLIRRWAQEAGWTVRAVEGIAPSLEDVFLVLLGQPAAPPANGATR